MDVITYALAKKMGGGGESITYTLTADTENKTIVLTPSRGTAQVITVPYATDASTVNGHEVPELENGKIPANFLPSFVDNVDEYDNISLFPVVGESNRIYIDKSTNKTYRWSGTAYVEISESIALGETSSTAYRGDRGKIAYDHSQSVHAPSNAEANQNAFSNVKIDSDIINASAATDTLEFIAGDNIILTPNVLNKKITVSQAPVRKSASGDIASFSDGAGYPFLKVKANINPVQDLHGYDYPWVGGAGKNKFDVDLPHEEVSGSATYSYTVTVKANTDYTMSCNVPQGSPASLYFNGTATNTNGVWDGAPRTFTSDANGNFVVYIRYNDTQGGIDLYTAVKNGTYYIQLEEGSSATSYVPYSNICPISGFTGVNVTVSPTTTEGSGTVYPISWQDEAGIVYGGYIDLVNGRLTKTLEGVDMGTLEWVKWTKSTRWLFYAITTGKVNNRVNTIPCEILNHLETSSTGMDNADGLLTEDNTIVASMNTTYPTVVARCNTYSDAQAFTTAVSGKKLVYELATPQTYQLTPQQINTLIGQNNVWNNTNGQTEVEYKAPFYNDLTTKNEVQALINESITSALNASY